MKEVESPKYTLMGKLYRLHDQLMDDLDKALDDANADFETVISLFFKIDEVVQLILESKGMSNDSTRSISRSKRRYNRNKVRTFGAEIRTTSKRSIRENICHEQDDQRACLTSGSLR